LHQLPASIIKQIEGILSLLEVLEMIGDIDMHPMQLEVIQCMIADMKTILNESEAQ
jgi:hypothetical protein